MAATPLVLCEPTMARLAMRIFRTGAFFDEADVCHPRFVPGVARPNVIQEPAVDLENNLQVPRQHVLKPLDRPFLERLRKQGMVGVSQDFPG